MSSVLRSAPRALLAALVCVGTLLLPASRAAAEPGIRILNALPTNHLAFNGLTTNRAALQALTTGPLNSTAFFNDPRLKQQLEDPVTRNVMTYLVGCALPPGAEVQWTSRTGQLHRFAGKVGLCPEWQSGAPGLACQGYVTACLLARNNAYGREVTLSLRGEDPVNPGRFNPAGLTEEWSPMFLPCATSTWGLTPECGWRGEGVGSCTPGTAVTVAAGAPKPDCTGTLGAISGDRVLRVCTEAQGCTRANRLADADQNACGTIAPSVTFTCPASGTYSVMSAPYNRSARPGTWVRPAATAGTYPSGSFGGFTFREGAFYGNMFDPGALSVEVTLDPANNFARVISKPAFQGYVYQNVHACHSRDWVAGDEHLALRACANDTFPTGDVRGCVALPAGPCEPGSMDTATPPRCAVNDGPRVRGDGDFESCQDRAGFPHPEPITVFLASPCDGLPTAQQQLCTTHCIYTRYPPLCTTTCRQKSAGECLQTEACLRDPANCPQ